MLELGGDLDLALESIDVDAGDQLRAEELHHDPSTECRLLGDKDAGHAAAAQLTLDQVGGADRLL